MYRCDTETFAVFLSPQNLLQLHFCGLSPFLFQRNTTLKSKRKSMNCIVIIRLVMTQPGRHFLASLTKIEK
ncbi:Uncharacterized protein APZ42_018019 [Daphnia magna]|uniref:Uncharacterized protein n=1 Tax=Daphnia magna TaxID=35525 RepID=A0A164ZGY2_9CRUS|nr:Uncharacterized protein APZ42_018019 [Daphnia magna]